MPANAIKQIHYIAKLQKAVKSLQFGNQQNELDWTINTGVICDTFNEPSTADVTQHKIWLDKDNEDNHDNNKLEEDNKGNNSTSQDDDNNDNGININSIDNANSIDPNTNPEVDVANRADKFLPSTDTNDDNTKGVKGVDYQMTRLGRISRLYN